MITILSAFISLFSFRVSSRASLEKMFHYGVRIEEMLIVHKDSVEIVSNFPVK